MTRYGVLLAIGSIAWLAASGPAHGDGQPPLESQVFTNPKDMCDKFHALVVDHKSFQLKGKVYDRSTDTIDAEVALQGCVGEEKLYQALDVVTDYQEVQDWEYNPYAGPKASDEGMKAINGYRKRFKAGTLDETSFKAVLHYLIWQSNNYVTGRAGAELAARMYPKEYVSLEPLSRDQHYIESADPTANAWLDMRHDWLPELEKADKH